MSLQNDIAAKLAAAKAAMETALGVEVRVILRPTYRTDVEPPELYEVQVELEANVAGPAKAREELAAAAQRRAQAQIEQDRSAAADAAIDRVMEERARAVATYRDP